jgi:DNA-directed RNA polymerase specialized sigma24 family protein
VLRRDLSEADCELVEANVIWAVRAAELGRRAVADPRRKATWAYLLTAAKNEARKVLVKRAALRPIPEDSASREATPADALQARELAERLHGCLQRLRPTLLVPFLMRHCYGLSSARIATILGIEAADPANAIDQRLMAARKILRAELAGEA